MNGLILFIGIIFCLWFGRSLLIPLLIAAFFWYLINALAAYYRRILPCYGSKIKQCKIPSRSFNFISIIFAFITLGGIIYLFLTQIKPMFLELYASLPTLQQKTALFVNYVYMYTGMNLDLLPNIPDLAKHIGSSLVGFGASVGMILIYLLFMFIEQNSFEKKLNALSTNKQKIKKIKYILSSIDDNIKRYLFTKTFISIATGLCSYILLSIIGLEYAGVWAFIIFILNYIPTIGSIIACALPILYALVTTNGMHTPILTAISLIIIQIIFGNILDPKLTGKTLNISTLAILINLVFCGLIWGPAGMFFSVPLLVTIYIISAQFNSSRWFAILLSSDGVIPDKTTED